MFSRSCLFAAALCLSSFAMAASPSIGTVTARGFTFVDSYRVQGSGTVFDGSVVETGYSALSSADLRLAKDGAVVTLDLNSRGTVYRDHFELQRGAVSVGSFRVLANGLVIAPSEAGSKGKVSIDQAKSVIVEVESGAFEILNPAGTAVAEVRKGQPLAFSTNGKPASVFSSEGTVTSENGRYYLTASTTGEKYELRGSDLRNYDGTLVVASGVLEAASPATGVAGILLASGFKSSNVVLLTGHSGQTTSLIGGLSVTKASSNSVVEGADGGYCQNTAEVPCCSNSSGGEWAGKKCCPGFVPPTSQCTSSN
jgi:hypothetical protein